MNKNLRNDIRGWVEAFSSRLLVDSVIPFHSACGMLLILAVAAVGTALHMHEATATLAYVLIIVLFAMRSGFFQASLVAVAAITCQTYFFEVPQYGFDLMTSRNATAMGLFEVTALIVSQLSAREKAHAAQSRSQRVKLERLYAVSRQALTIDLGQPAEQQMAELILAEFHFEAVAICNAMFDTVGAAGLWESDLEAVCQQMRAGNPISPALLEDALQAELRTVNGSFGTLLIRGRGMTQLGLESLASLVGLTVERQHACRKEGEAEAARRTEQLRTTVLDGLAHAFKTPLTVIRAASSGLLELGDLTEVQRELTGMIDEQSAWLDDLATRLLETARVEGEEICLQREMVEVSELLRGVVADFRRESLRGSSNGAAESTISISLPQEPVLVSADHDLLHTTLSELLLNAVKYSSAGKSISLSATSRDDELLLSVHSWGNVISLDDRERIFDRFYRCRDYREIAEGTGIGLSVARRTAEAHMGNIWVTSSELEGTTFNISLPLHFAAMEPQERNSTWQRKY